MRVNIHISNLFFNSQHNYEKQTTKLPIQQQYRQGFNTIHTEASEFLSSLSGVLEAWEIEDADLPSVEDLIADFFARL
jgi:hypothetical protein